MQASLKPFLKTFLVFFLCISASLGAQNKTRIPLIHGAHRIGRRTDPAMQHWRDYGLGQFIHWGVYAIPGGQWKGKTTRGAAEWIRASGIISHKDYDHLYKQFNPLCFDAQEWAKTAKRMGVKYVIFTTKHHDGFCMWPSRYTHYTIASTPYKKDIVKQIVDAYNAQGIDVYLYYSIIDWSQQGYTEGKPISETDKEHWQNYHPFKSAKEEANYNQFKTFTRNQLKELLANYPTIKGFWFDGTWDGAWMKQAAWVDSLDNELRKIHPGLIIGSRFRADENGARHVDSNGDIIDDYDQRFERELPNSLQDVKGNDWECVMTIPENQWGYHRDWSLSHIKSAYELLEMMAKANSLDGNFVINFGPDGTGKIRPEETRIAHEIGNWMRINNQAIYNTHHTPLPKQDWGYSTQNEDSIYLIIFNKPMNNKVRVIVPKNNNRDKESMIEKAVLLSNKHTIHIEYAGHNKSGATLFDLLLPPQINKRTMPFVIRIKIKDTCKIGSHTYQQALT